MPTYCNTDLMSEAKYIGIAGLCVRHEQTIRDINNVQCFEILNCKSITMH